MLPASLRLSGPPLPPARYTCFAELIFDMGDEVIILGTWGTGPLNVSMGKLREVTAFLDGWLAEHDLAPGDTVALLRLPRTSETVVAVLWLGLVTLGYRVLFPMYLEPAALGDWLSRTQSKAIFWSFAEGVTRSEVDADRRFAQSLDLQGRPAWCLEADLGLPARIAAPTQEPAPAQVARLRARASDTVCTILTTSGTSGHAHLVCYTQSAWLRSCMAWEVAGLYAADQLGGRGLCLLLGHSMGLRALVNALWTRQPLCVLPPEWFLEHPGRVHDLLIQHRPAHVSGGPSVFRTLLELGRVFPSLKDACLRHLRCAVSIGAPFEPALARQLESTLRLPLHAGFGMTETLLVSCTLLGGARGAGALGAPLPGVQLCLEPTDEAGIYRLLIQSAFGAVGYLDAPFTDWLPTGDLVRADLSYVGREHEDFFKDGFGVKINRRTFTARYAGLGAPILHIEPFPLREEPGLAGLVFVDAPIDAALTRQVRSRLEEREEELRSALEEMDFRHGTLRCFACVAGPPPQTRKGTVARGALLQQYAALIQAITGRWQKAAGRDRLERDTLTHSALARYASPSLGQLLKLARLDLDFSGASGDRLSYQSKGEPREVLDLVGGFGGNLLGHRHPDVVAAAQQVIGGGGPPLFDQGSGWRAQGELARGLAGLIGARTGQSYVVRLVSTGAEAVEVALAHAWLSYRRRLERRIEAQRRSFGDRDPEGVRRLEDAARAAFTPRVFALKGAYHGHSLGARALLDSPRRRGPFAPLLRLEVTWLTGAEDVEALVRDTSLLLPMLREEGGQIVTHMERFPTYFASFAEPVSGEGGMRTTDPDLLRRLSGLDVPLILDEIQCGLGRTGQLPASPVRGDVLLLAKALGGGLAKIGAVLIERGGYLEDFEEWYASTFAGDRLSCEVASAVIRVIAAEDVPGRARRIGARLRAGLEQVARACPAIASVHGEGLMLGVELSATTEEFVHRALLSQERLGLVAAGWLLHRRGVRVLPALSAPTVLRVEPSAFLSDADIDAVIDAFAALGAVLQSGDAAALLGWLVEDERAPTTPPPRPLPVDVRVQPPPPDAVRVGFLHHFVRPEEELSAAAPTLAGFSFAARRSLFDRLTALCAGHPLVLYSQPLLKGRAWMSGVILPFEASALDDARRSGDLDRIVARIQEGVNLAAAQGCTVVALGGATSIVTDNGRALLAPPGVRLVSGNSLTAAIGAARLRACADHDGWLGILGASGNIGSAVARRLIGPGGWRKAVLVGRDPAHLASLRDLDGELLLSTDVRDLARCQAILTATATSEPLLYPEHLHPDGAWIADLAVPSPVAATVWADRRARRVPHAGYVRLPTDPHFVQSTITPEGAAFCCATEGLLVALHPDATADLRLVGELEPRSLAVLESLAREEGLWME